VEHGLDTQLLAIVAGAVAAWSLVGARLQRFYVSAPIAFVVVGLVVANPPLDLVDVSIASTQLRTLAELTLAVLLFSDAARVNLRELRRDTGVPVRLLVIGLPLTIAFGTLLAVVLFTGLNIWVAAVIAAAVAPTDAALGAQVVQDHHVPSRIRRSLNVESGLNDGIATPFVSFFVAAAASELQAHPATSVAGAIGDLAIGALTGIAVGLGGAALMALVRRVRWSEDSYRGISVLAFAVLAYALALELDANGFVAAFVAGLAFGSAFESGDRDASIEFDAQVGELLSWVIWFLFGAVMTTALGATTWQTVVFAIGALTVVRIVAVAVSLAGARLHALTVLFIGWFGPRGLASIVFGLIAYDALGGHDGDVVLATVTLTVLVSVVAHGVSASPLSRRYGARLAEASGARPEHGAVTALASRSRSASS
jgi:NhaP-type Na+/H+ or K+/H+ antiporter